MKDFKIDLKELLSKMLNELLVENEISKAQTELTETVVHMVGECVANYLSQNYVTPDSVLHHYHQFENCSEEDFLTALELLFKERNAVGDYIFHAEVYWIAVLAVKLFLKQWEGNKGIYVATENLADTFNKEKMPDNPYAKCKRSNLEKKEKKIGLNLFEWEYHKKEDAYSNCWCVASFLLQFIEQVCNQHTGHCTQTR